METPDRFLDVLYPLCESIYSTYELVPLMFFWELLIFFIFCYLVLFFRKKPADDSAIDKAGTEDLSEPEKVETSTPVEKKPAEGTPEEDISAPLSEEPKKDIKKKPEAEKAEPDPPKEQLKPEPPKKDIPPPPEEKPKEGVSFFQRLKQGMSKTRNNLTSGLDKIFTAGRSIDDDLLEEIEELLITSDIGVQTTMDLVERISKKTSSLKDAGMLKAALKEEVLSLIGAPPEPVDYTVKPHVIMVVGVNGVGKTTTIGKLAARFNAEGKKVLIAAADTFRAAAVEQLTIWAERANAEIVKHKENSDPAAVAYDSIEAAIAREADIVLVDTAGRLHTKVNLMEELKKIKRTISKKLPDAPHETLIVLDATTGQNALSQAKLFHETLEITGIAMTKLDGTAKGGIVVGVCDTLNVPLKYIGVGEQIDDLQDFDPKQYAETLF